MALAFIAESFDGDVWSSTYKHPNSLSACVKGLYQQDFDLAIRLAVTALESMKASANKLQYKEALSQEIAKVLEENTKEKEKLVLKESLERKKLEGSHSEKIQELEVQIQKLKASLLVADHTSSKLREQLQSSGSIFESSLQEVSRQKEVQHEKELERLERVYKERMESMKIAFQEQEEKLRKQVERNFVSSEKGKQGEKEFDELASQYTSWGPLKNTSKTAHSTDREALIRGCNVRFELKNYSGEVPGSEVTKFERDMEENHNCPLGVFISLKSGICNRKSDGFMCIRWSSRNQMLIYINNFYNHSVEDLFKFIDMNIEVALLFYTQANGSKTESSEGLILLQSRIEQAKVIIEKECIRINSFLNSVKQQKLFLVETLTKHNTENVYHIKHSITALKEMLDILLGQPINESPNEGPNESVEGSTQVTVEEFAEQPKKKTTSKKSKNKEVIRIEGDGTL